MAKINLHSNGLNSATNVPNEFIDDYMTSANGEFVKVYLYLLRCISNPNCDFSVSNMADRFDHTEKDIRRALRYWEKMHLLKLEYDVDKHLIGICLLPALSDSSTANSTPSSPTKETYEKEIVEATPLEIQKPHYTLEQLETFQRREDVEEILFITERYLGRTLNPTDIQSILFWCDELNLPISLIEYLIESCVSNGHTSLRYMEKVAISWKDAKITTVSEAQQANRMHSQSAFAIMKYYGITGRNLIDSELKFVDKWTADYAFSQDILKEACKRTILATGKARFEYTDKILTTWHQSGVKHLDDVLKLDDTHQKGKEKDDSSAKKPLAPGHFNNFSQRNYNYDQLEQQLLKSRQS